MPDSTQAELRELLEVGASDGAVQAEHLGDLARRERLRGTSQVAVDAATRRVAEHVGELAEIRAVLVVRGLHRRHSIAGRAP